MENNYYKVVGIVVDALSATIVSDVNVKNIKDASMYIENHCRGNETATWIILPCSCGIKVN